MQASLAFLYCLQRIDARSWRRAASCRSAAVGAALSAAIGLVSWVLYADEPEGAAESQQSRSESAERLAAGEGSPAEGSRAECCFGLAYL